MGLPGDTIGVPAWMQYTSYSILMQWSERMIPRQGILKRL